MLILFMMRLVMTRAGRVRLLAGLFCAAMACPVGSVRGDQIFPGAKPFFEDNCTDCHNTDLKTGRLDLTTLEYHPEDSANFALWVKIHDRVQAGEMPPKKKARPDPAKLKAFVNDMDAMLKASEKTMMAGEGRAVDRRLNRY